VLGVELPQQAKKCPSQIIIDVPVKVGFSLPSFKTDDLLESQELLKLLLEEAGIQAGDGSEGRQGEGGVAAFQEFQESLPRRTVLEYLQMGNDLRSPSSLEGGAGVQDDPAADRGHRRVAPEDIPIVKLSGGGLLKSEVNICLPPRVHLFAVQDNDAGQDLDRAEMESDSSPVP
jgi:hypothetical protein